MPTMPENEFGQAPGEPSSLGRPGQMSGGSGAMPGSFGGQMSGQGSMPGQMSDQARPLSGAQMGAEMPYEGNRGENLSATAGGRAEDLIQRVAQGAHETVDRLAAKAVPAVQKLRAGATDTRGALSEQATRAKEVSGEWAESFRSTVREHPIAAVAIAAFVGMLYGRMRSDD